MKPRQFKAAYFVLEGLNAFATSFYFYYLFFFMQRQFGYGNRQNLILAALNGFIYTFMAWLAGRAGQRFGYFKALGTGFSIMIMALFLGACANSEAGQVGVLALWTMGVCFTWPNLEALVSEDEQPSGLQQMIGIYNLVWAGASATAFFCGGYLLEHLGIRSLFWLPISIHLTQCVLLLLIRSQAAQPDTSVVPSPSAEIIPLNPRPIARARAFLQMAWVANPFAYVAINTVVAIVPSLAHKLELSPAAAGFFCSVWFFARLGTFFLLWRWNGWHYRRRWFLGAYILLVTSFMCLLLVPKFAVILMAQIAFGIAIGLIYYSSLYYSMNAGEAKGEHGGMHEAAIGAGIFAGPAIGATALYCLPMYANSSAWAVTVALCGGLVGLVKLSRRSR